MRVSDKYAGADAPFEGGVTDQSEINHQNEIGRMLFTRRTAIASAASTLLITAACEPLPPPGSLPPPPPPPPPGVLQSIFDFTKPVWLDPQLAIEWRRGSPLNLGQFYPDQPGMDLLRFARSDEVAYTDVYLDNGLVLEMRARVDNQSFGVFFPKPFKPDASGAVPKIYGLEVGVWFDTFAVRQSWDYPFNPDRTFPSFIGAISALGTKADVEAGRLTDPPTDKNIGATCPCSYDPGGDVVDDVSADVQRMRLHGPFYNPKIHGTMRPFDFATKKPFPHPFPPSGSYLPSGRYSNHSRWPLRLHFKANVSKDPATPAQSTLDLIQPRPDGGVRDSCGPGNSAFYTDNFDDLNWAGAALVISDATESPYDLGPATVRITRLEISFDTRPPG